MPSREPRRVPCNRPDCDGRLIVFAVREDTGRPVPYDAEPVDIDRVGANGCHVLVEGQAWKPGRLAEHFQVAFELPSLERAHQLVREYQHHRPHLHLTTDTEGDRP